MTGVRLKTKDSATPDVERPLPPCWEQGPSPISLTLTANAGILVSHRGERFLVDGLHGGGDHSFSPVPPALLEEICRGEEPFSSIDWLLFTHLHTDHFSAAWTKRFMEQNRVKGLFLPAGDGGAGGDPQIGELRAYLMSSAAPVRELKLPEGRPVRYPLGAESAVTAFFAQHAGQAYQEMQHYCLLFTLGGRNLLFLGDADYDKDYFSAVLAGVPVDAVVVNPLFLNKAAGRAVLTQAICPKKMIVCHIPFCGEDTLRFREMVARDLGRFKDRLPPTAVLWDPQDTITW